MSARWLLPEQEKEDCWLLPLLEVGHRLQWKDWSPSDLSVLEMIHPEVEPISASISVPQA